ncbi:hypothetical protein FQN60_013923 [Etheostoma spectabile]|uniref:Uncharacterized protein n=1 Tax=Etheostoma spectabile TaxID=54343 RepID=A0A5J5CJ50_9PERO|nr:hypothetical protein FQN60_013923 [Etheostoma spectabile]
MVACVKLLLSSVVVPDEASEKAGLGDELGSEEDLLYEEFHSSGHRFGHPGGGGGEQLAINEAPSLHWQAGATLAVGKVAGEAEKASAGAERRRSAAPGDGDGDSRGGGRGDAVWCGGLVPRERRRGRGSGAEEEEEDEARGLMARGSGSGRWSRQRLGFFTTVLRCNLPPETQKVVVFVIMMLLIVINVVLMFLLAFQ